MVHVYQFKLNIFWPSELSGISKFANRAKIGSCDSSDLIWSFETGSLEAWL